MMRVRVPLLVMSLAAAHASASSPAVAANESAQPAMTLDALMARFRALPGLSAKFREDKHIALLAEPLVSSGVVYYAAPRRFARHTTAPSPSSVVLDGDKLTFWSGGSDPNTLDVRQNTIASAFVDGFLGVVAGDRAALDRNFVVDFHAGDAAHPGSQWEIGLAPRSDAVKKLLQEVRFKGDGVLVKEMRVREANGDEGITTFSDVDPARHFTPDEASKIFRARAH